MAVMLVIALVAVAIPYCEMIGCNMGMCGGMMRISTIPGPRISSECGGAWLSSSPLAGVMPPEFLTMLMMILAAFAAAVVLFSPNMVSAPVRVIDANAPPPPLEPGGERLRL